MIVRAYFYLKRKISPEKSSILLLTIVLPYAAIHCLEIAICGPEIVLRGPAIAIHGSDIPIYCSEGLIFYP